MPIDVWSAGDEAALSEVCGVIEPLLFRYLLNETQDAALAQELLEQTLLRVQFGAYGRGGDVVGWALEIASRLALTRRLGTPAEGVPKARAEE
jgi:DNA-directed RNA polymerase specialized sigma24 family protein